MEEVAARALGTRTTAVRAFRRRLPLPADPAAGAPDPSSHTILLAAEARHARFLLRMLNADGSACTLA